MRSMFNGEGYYLNDNRASGGLKQEDGIISCTHGQCCIEKTKWREGKTGGYCPQCDGPLCDYHVKRMQKFGCEPFIRQFTEKLNDHYRKQQNAKILGI